IIFPHGEPFDTLTWPVDDAAFVQTRPPMPSLAPVDPGLERICGPSGTWRYSRKIVLSVAAAVVPSSMAYHWRSTPTSCAPRAFFRHVLPPSFDTEVLTLVRASRSEKYANPWSSTTTSVSPPPGGASGRTPSGLSSWNSSPSSVERCTHDCC